MSTAAEATTVEKRETRRPPAAVPAAPVAEMVPPLPLAATRAKVKAMGEAVATPGYGTPPNRARHVATLLALQQTHGNRYVQRLIAAQARAQAVTPEREEEIGGRPASPAPMAGGARDLAGAIGAEGGRGQPLPDAVRRRVEPVLGASLANVQVHTDTAADGLTRAVEAVAFTTGSDIFFRAGAYDPASPEGLHLLAHEVTHTLQQAAGPVAGTPAAGGVAVSDPADRFEQAAGAAADRVLAGPLQEEESLPHEPAVAPLAGPRGREFGTTLPIPRPPAGAVDIAAHPAGERPALPEGPSPEPDEEEWQEEAAASALHTGRLAAGGPGDPGHRATTAPVLQREEAGAGEGAGAGAARGRGTTTIRPVARATYPVEGATLAEAAAQIEAREEAGVTEWNPAYSLSRDDEGNVTDATVTVTITVTMPNWPGAARLPAATRAEWDRFYAALEAHEQGHVSLVQENLRDVADAMVDKSEAEAIAAFEAALANLQQVNDAYDAANDHGRNAGCTLDLGEEQPAEGSSASESTEATGTTAPAVGPTAGQGQPAQPRSEETAASEPGGAEPPGPGPRTVQQAVLPGQRVPREQPVQRRADSSNGSAGVAQGAPAATPLVVVQRETVQLGGLTASTHGHLLAALHYFVGLIRQELEDVDAGVSARRRAEELLSNARELEPYLRSRQDQPLDELAASQARLWHTEFVGALEDLQSYKRRRAAEQLAEAQGPIAEAQRRLEAQQPRLDDLMRAAFLAENPGLLEQVTGAVSNSLDTGLALSELSRDLASDVARIRSGTGALPPVGEYTRLLVGLNRALAAYSLLTTALSGGGGGRTAMSEGANRVSAAAGAASSLGTLMGLSATFSLYCNLYLVPAATAAMAAVRRIITQHNHELNLLAMEMGEGTIDWSVEPGGEPMYRFMGAVMAAGDAEGVPDPVPAAVSSYFVDQGDALQTGTGQEVPTTGMWFWTRTDPARIRRWVFRNRRNLWAMFYGSLRPPA